MRKSSSTVLHMFSVSDGDKGENAVSYYIVPSAREIHVAKDGTLTPAGGAAGNAKAVALTLTLYSRVTGEEDKQKIGYWTLNGTPPGVTLVDEPESTASLRLRVDTSVAVNVPVTVYDSVIDLKTSQPVRGAWLADITIPVVRDGADGQSVIICDFDDEMTQIPCDSEGKLVGTFTWSTSGHLMKGTSALQLAEDQCSYEVISGALSCGLAVEGSTAIFTVNGFGDNATDENKVRVTLGDAAGNKKSQVLTVAKNRSGAPGVAPDIYQLSPSPTSLAIDGLGQLKTDSFTVKVKKNGVELASMPASPVLTLQVKTTFKSGDTRTGGYNLYAPISVASLPDSSGLAVKDITSVELTLKEGTKVRDVETLYMLADGAKGTGVTVRSVTYAASSTGTRPADTAFIYPSFPSVPAGTYVWSRTEYSDGSVVYSVSRAGKDGHSAELRYKLSNTKPTDNPSSGTGWVTDIPTATPGFKIQSGQWQQGSAGWYESPTTEHDGISTDTVPIETFGDNVEVEILYRASTETLEEDGGMTGYDNGYIGALDADNPVNNYLKEFSGLESGSLKITIPKAGRHFIRIAYRKDSSDDYYVHDDKIYYKFNTTSKTTVTGIWRVEAIEWNDNGTVKTWSDPVRINGIDPSLQGRIQFKEWALGESYQSGQDGEEYQHIVPYNNTFYACRMSIERATADHLPGPNSGYWYQASDFSFIAAMVFYAVNAFIEKLSVSRLLSESLNGSVFIGDGTVKFFGPELAHPNIVLGTDANGCAVLKFYDHDGNFKYDLGPDSIVQQLGDEPNRWTELQAMASLLLGNPAADLYEANYSTANLRTMVTLSSYTTYLQFVEGYNYINSVKRYRVSGETTPSNYHLKVYGSTSMTGSPAHPAGTTIPAGHYVGEERKVRSTSQYNTQAGIYKRDVYAVSAAGALPVRLGTYYYYRDENVQDAYLTDSAGTRLAVSTAKPMSTYIQNSPAR